MVSLCSSVSRNFTKEDVQLSPQSSLEQAVEKGLRVGVASLQSVQFFMGLTIFTNFLRFFKGESPTPT